MKSLLENSSPWTPPFPYYQSHVHGGCLILANHHMSLEASFSCKYLDWLIVTQGQYVTMCRTGHCLVLPSPLCCHRLGLGVGGRSPGPGPAPGHALDNPITAPNQLAPEPNQPAPGLNQPAPGLNQPAPGLNQPPSSQI